MPLSEIPARIAYETEAWGADRKWALGLGIRVGSAATTSGEGVPDQLEGAHPTAQACRLDRPQVVRPGGPNPLGP